MPARAQKSAAARKPQPSGWRPGGGIPPYACRPEASRGRLHAEPESSTRSPFQRDRDRVIHSTSFRRLKFKTQVFVYHEGDHFRTRLTHSIEVAQIARSIARQLGLNEDLAEALALAHDLGHTPFGHTGEDALHEVMAPYGGFDHNAQTLRILTKLEHRYAEFDGLNLTWETLEGVVKHNGPMTGPLAARKAPLPAAIVEYVARHDLELDTWPGAEAQIASLSDDIAYNNHDIDDGLRAGLFDVADLADVPLVGPVFAEVHRRYGQLEQSRLIGESIRRMIDRMVTDLVAETTARLDAARPDSPDAVRRLGRPIAAFSDALAGQMRILREFLHARMYRHARVAADRDHAKGVVRDLFNLLFDDPRKLPEEWQTRVDAADKIKRARLVADYIAGMTDRFALEEHRRLSGGAN
jgi:dGTPase